MEVSKANKNFNGIQGLHFRGLLIIAGILVAGSALAADSTCKYLADANSKIYTIPTHMFMTETASYTGGKAQSSELIYLNNKTYFQVNEKWSVSPATPEKMQEIRKESEAQNLKMTCRVVRDEAVNGEPSTLYSGHKQDPDEKIDTQIWISKSRGVPLKLETDMDVGGGAAGKSHRSIRYEYKNVQAPPGV